MLRQFTAKQVLIVIGTLALVALIALLPTAAPISHAQGNPTATPSLGDAGDNATPEAGVSNPTGGGGKFSLPPTLDDLIASDPDLKAYLDKVKDVKVGEFDFSELYTVLAKVYDKEGLAGVIIFMRDSGLLEKLNIPAEYVDLMLLLDKGDKGREEAIDNARKLGLISDKDELRGFLLLDADDKASAAETSLQGLGVSTYPYNADTGELEIGIPMALIESLQTPSKLFGLFVKIGSTPGVIGFRVPKPNLTPAKK